MTVRPFARSGSFVVRSLLIALLLPLALGCASAPDGASVSQPSVAGAQASGAERSADVSQSPEGMVVSGHRFASEVGAEVLARGGNAVDAAVAVGFALAAVLPRAGNIGGGGFLVYRDAAGETRTLDFRETAPAAAHRDMYLDAEGRLTDQSVIGHRAAGVPGTVAGLWEMHRRLGRLPWHDLVEPAVDLARGHVVDAVRHEDILRHADDLRRFPASAGQYLPGGEPPPVGEVWRQDDLVWTLEQIAARGADAFYRGAVAERIVSEMERGGGLITAQDLASYRPIWREAVVLDYRGYTVVTMPPPSSGGITLALIFNMLESREGLPPFGSVDLLHLEAEVMRRAFLERNRHLGDPDFVTMPLERLLSESYARQLAADIGPRATPSLELDAALLESRETTHYSIVDGEGNAVALTTTLNSSFGNKVTVAGAGFLLNNEMDDFAAAPGRPNAFGLVQGEANAIEPGKRMLSSMTPTLVLDPDDRLLLVLGSPGGPSIITAVFQVISNVLDHGQALEQAVESARIHHQALPDQIFVEAGRMDRVTQEALRERGHRIEIWSSGLIGNVSAIARTPGGWLGVADPRRDGAAVAPDDAEDSARVAAVGGLAH